ncbi:MAG: hypothetical protein OXG85_06130 [Chloroflexi bacterium]|nr:hypothetical protein [Chloroflexota bacterium]
METRKRYHPRRGKAAVTRRKLTRRNLLLWLLLFPIVSAAQADPRNYSISPPTVSYTADGGSAIVSFTVANQGGDAAESSRIVVSEYQSGRVERTEILPALAAGEERAFSIQLPLGRLPAEGIISFKIEAGLDEYELANSPIARDNSQLLNIDRSAVLEALESDASIESSEPPQPAFDIFIPIVNLGVNFLPGGIQLNEGHVSGDDILRAVAMLALALFCLWLLSLIFRLVFRRPPRFGAWQPPYALNNWHDPNSVPGRRQAWQFHAQNNSIEAQGAPDQVAVVKRLLDKRGAVLGGWKVKALRTVQYDVYGRINRTEVWMPHKVVGMLNRALQRAPGYTSGELRKAMLPIAQRISKRALGPIESQNLMLPIALEIRFEGPADETRILFELYQYRAGAWRLVDHWDAELGQTGGQAPEQYTFTLNGQLPGESKSELKQRLREDIAHVLASLFYQEQMADGADPQADSALGLKDLLPEPAVANSRSALEDERGSKAYANHESTDYQLPKGEEDHASNNPRHCERPA